MGKGDIKTRRGKIFRGTYGVSRPRRKNKPNMIKDLKECVYCGTPMLRKKESLKIEKKDKKYPDRGETKDHVPQKCLFDGYSSNYKENRFTVPSCHKCNFEFSQVEHELRDLIGIANDKNELQKIITESSIKSILEQPDGEERLRKDNQGLVRGVKFNLDTLLPSHVKNFKGVFYKTFGKRFPDSFVIHVLDKKSNINFEELAIDFINNNCTWNFSGHPDIFKFKIALIKADNKGLLIKANNINESVGVLCHLLYHNSFNMLILANRKTITKKKIQ